MKLLCHECGASCATEIPKNSVIRAYVICGDCMNKVPEYLWQNMIAAIHSDGSKRFQETPDDGMFAGYEEGSSRTIDLKGVPMTAESIKESIDTALAKESILPAINCPVIALANLSKNDRREYRLFLRYLKLRDKYGDAVLLTRPFWRKYLLGENEG